jgi:adenylosuccinate synthase
MWERLGSTAHGVGAARVARIWRTAQTVGDAPTRLPDDVLIENTTEVIAQALHAGEGVMVEGAQGHHLSLYSGGFYPFCTSGECGPTQAFADMGLPLDAAGEFETAAVFRTFPIRVAGNSGPLTGETSWEALRRTYGEHIPVEQTTVTARVRRVGAFDPALARRSVMENGIHWAVLSFLDYPFPEVAGVTAWENLTAEARRLTLVREQQLGIPIRYVATGFGTFAEVPHRVGATA